MRSEPSQSSCSLLNTAALGTKTSTHEPLGDIPHSNQNTPIFKWLQRSCTQRAFCLLFSVLTVEIFTQFLKRSVPASFVHSVGVTLLNFSCGHWGQKIENYNFMKRIVHRYTDVPVKASREKSNGMRLCRLVTWAVSGVFVLFCFFFF